MTRLSTLGRTIAIATVVAGVLMFALAVQGVTNSEGAEAGWGRSSIAL